MKAFVFLAIYPDGFLPCVNRQEADILAEKEDVEIRVISQRIYTVLTNRRATYAEILRYSHPRSK